MSRPIAIDIEPQYLLRFSAMAHHEMVASQPNCQYPKIHPRGLFFLDITAEEVKDTCDQLDKMLVQLNMSMSATIIFITNFSLYGKSADLLFIPSDFVDLFEAARDKLQCQIPTLRPLN